MRRFTNMFPGIVLLLMVVLVCGPGMTQESKPAGQPASVEKEMSAAAPELAEIVPLAATLARRLVVLEKKIRDGLDISKVEKNYGKIETDLIALAEQLQRFRNSKGYKYNKLVELKGTLDDDNLAYEAVSIPVRQTIRQLENWRKEWLAEQSLWNEWQALLDKEGSFAQLESSFKKAHSTIDTALDLVLSRLEAVLAVQEKAADIRAEIGGLDSDINDLIEAERRSALLDESPPMVSPQFFSQFKSGDFWFTVLQSLKEISWPDRRFLARQGWIISLQVLLTILVIVAIQRNRKVLEESKRWRFFAARPFSTGLFLGYMATLLLYEYQGGVPATWKLLNTIVAATSFARLTGGLIEIAWQRHYVNGLMTVLVATRLMDVLSFPLPLFRLYIVFAALGGLLFCWRLATESIRNKDAGLYARLMRLGALFFAVIIFAELWGKKALASYLFVSLIRTEATVLVFILFMYMIRGGMEWLFRNSPLRRTAVADSDDTEAIIKRLARFMDVVILGLVLLPAILMIWGVYDTLPGATKGLLSLEFNLGHLKISVGLLLLSMGILYGSFLASWVVQKMLVDEEVFLKRRVQKGVRLSIARLAHYAIILVGFLFALSTLGFEISKITIMLSALGVGIGFGLQGIVNNFVSGLILLFERPVRVGDVIQITGDWAEIKNIGIRATTVQTFDRADRIIPNANLISNEVTNWTLSNRQIRLIIKMGVAYGSDIDLVTETLLACAQTNPKVEQRPSPSVLFLNFGESALDFELRVFVADFNERIAVRNALNRQIDRSFREANIEIAFPQRDVHVRGVDDATTLMPPENTGLKPSENAG